MESRPFCQKVPELRHFLKNESSVSQKKIENDKSGKNYRESTQKLENLDDHQRKVQNPRR